MIRDARLPFTALLLLAWLAMPAVAAAQAGEFPEPEEMVRLWQEYSTPGEHHHRTLARLVGDWSVESVTIMPGGEQSSEWTASCRWLIPELFVSCEAEGLFMGEPTSSFYVFGYDKYKKKYVSAFGSTWSTALDTAEGVVVDPEDRVQVTYGTVDEFLTGEHDKPAKYVRRWIDDDRFNYEVWDLGIGPDGAKVIDMIWTRADGS